jgi:mannose-6-phosphate isomerase-like protein (cupin superfamily)
MIGSMARAGEQLVNPITGERIVFRLTAAETAGRLLEMDDFWTRPGHRAPEHVHPQMHEQWEIISGRASFRIGDREQTVGPGEVVSAPAGVAHVAWNPTQEPVHLRIQMSPALDWEVFVERLFALASSVEADPDPVQMLQLLHEFPREIALPPPAATRRRGAQNR